MMNYAKAENLHGAVQTIGYQPTATALASNRLYRIWLLCGEKSDAIGKSNHEVIAIAGANSNVRAITAATPLSFS